MDLRDELIERFFRYAAIESQSDALASQLPSSPGQLELARLLADELREMSIEDVTVDDQAIVTGVRRGTQPHAPAIGFIAHLDTVDVSLSPKIKPQIHRFTGNDLCLNAAQDIWLRAKEHPEILRWKDQDIITSDGTSVLGADNKAAIAIIMTLMARLGPPETHGRVFVAFVPDKEIGLRGAKALDLSRFPCDYAYTIDCCELGEIVIENFNAASAEIIFTGISAHPMSAKGALANPLLMAMDFMSNFDRSDMPEYSSGREGFFWFNALVANNSTAVLSVLIRDFDIIRFDQRKQMILAAVEKLGTQYPTGKIQFCLSDTYRNIAPCLRKDIRAAHLLLAAFDQLGIDPKFIPMRGGTDGAVLSEQGIPTPNFFTGACNFHSRYEYLPVPAFIRSYEVAQTVCLRAANAFS